MAAKATATTVTTTTAATTRNAQIVRSNKWTQQECIDLLDILKDIDNSSCLSLKQKFTDAKIGQQMFEKG